jgi:hypothetical protein
MWRFAALGMMGLRYAGVGHEQPVNKQYGPLKEA